MIKKIISAVFLLISLSSPSFAEEDPGAALIYGEGHSYVLIAPQGWTLDSTSGAPQGLLAVFYKKEVSFKDAGAVMYTNVIRPEGKDAAKEINNEIEGYRKNIPGLKIEGKGRITIGEGVTAMVFHLTGGNTVFEAVAYVPGEKTIVVIGLTAKKEQEFKDGLKPFEELVRSYIDIENGEALVAGPQEEEAEDAP